MRVLVLVLVLVRFGTVSHVGVSPSGRFSCENRTSVVVTLFATV